MVRESERRARSEEEPIVGGLPEVPGILVAMRLTRGLGEHLRGLADELLVNDYPGATLTRGERELVATAVSSVNDCFYCMDIHGAFAAELLRRAGAEEIDPLVDSVKRGTTDGASPKMAALLDLARTVARSGRQATRAQVERAQASGATEGDVQLAVLIASAFCMYNRMVDGLRARTPSSPEAYRERARQIADHGYSDPRVQAIPK